MAPPLTRLFADSVQTTIKFMRITWSSRDSRNHAIQLNGADYGLCDLMGFQQFALLFQCCFADGGGPWMPSGWMRRWFEILAWELEMQRHVLPYRYGANGDFGGGETVSINGAVWSLDLGAGECSLSQALPVESQTSPGHPGSWRLNKLMDLRGQSQLQTDDRIIKFSRRKQEFRWYAELPGLVQFFEGLRPDVDVRAQRLN